MHPALFISVFFFALLCFHALKKLLPSVELAYKLNTSLNILENMHMYKKLGISLVVC